MFPGLLTGAILGVGAPATDDTRGLTSPGSPRTEERKDALARYGAAVWDARRDRLLSAAKGFEAAAKQDPEATAPLKELVRVYVQLGREPEAIRIARKTGWLR